MSGYTPGPWEMDLTRERGHVVWQIGGRDGDTAVTKVDGFYGCVNGSALRRISEEENVANARLIVAAPALLEALIEAGSILASTFGNVTDPNNPDGWDDPEMFRSWKRIVEVIAKAEGA